MNKKSLLLLVALLVTLQVGAQRVTDKLDRGIVAVPTNSGTSYLVTWRKFGSEYYDTKYNFYRNGSKIASNLEVTNYTVAGGTSADTYQVEPVVRGVAQAKSAPVQAWANQYLEVKVQPVVNRNGETLGNASTNGNSNSVAGYTLNDVSLADVDGDGICELIVKRNNDTGNRLSADNTTDFNLYECYKIDGTRLWWIDLGPNLMAGPDEQWDMIGYDWDRDGKAELIMRGADNMIIHTASGKTIKVGDMTYYAPRAEYTHEGAEYLLYLDGATGEPFDWDGGDTYQPMAYPLPRFEEGETSYAAVWGSNDTGHRSSKHYFGAPYLDGRNPSIFLGRGCYTRHKFCALDVDPATHKLTQRWRWNCYDSSSPWYGNGFHNFAIADVDMDGRDEIVFGSMIIDDTGYGLCTTGYGHGDAQHCGDLDPYRKGLEQFTCLEGLAMPNNCYYNATTGEIYYQASSGSDDGRCLAGNFSNDIPGGQGRSVASGILSLSADKIIATDGDSYMAWGDLNNRIYWDGDLCDEIMNSPGVQRSVKITKYGNGRLSFYNSGGQYTPTGILNNSSKNNPSAQGDIFGDWREELVLRTSNNAALHIYTTNYATDYGIYTLWHDHVYRNGMAWQCVGYNQPPHTSFFLGELEGITVAPPPLILEGRTEVANGSTISGTTDDHLLVSGYENKTITVADGASPYILTVNAPAWVQGSGSQQATASTPKSPARTIINYTTTLTGGAFGGATRLVKQGEGTLVLPNVTEKHTGNTDIWNGTLQFDGTMEASPVWLNRHTTLISNGGKFLGGLKADYNATIYPGGENTVGSITASTLALGFGSRIVMDVSAGGSDQVNADKLTIETKDWEVGPKYKNPVIQFNVAGTLAAGKYLLGTIGTVEGSLGDILLEGISDKRHYLSIEEGKLYLVIEDMRAAATVIWNGTSDSNVWDFGVTKNFLNEGISDYAGLDDEVVFNDDAANTTVSIKGAVYPKSITFANETKAYTVTGDSILGGATITKTGAGTVTINTENRTGSTYINGGKVVVNMLANKSGQAYGSLGDASQAISINDATLSANGTISTDQPIRVTGNATIEVPSGKSLSLGSGVKGVGSTLNKTGAGSLMLGTANTFSRLVVKAGSVTSSENNSGVMQLPDTVELQGGTLYDVANENTYSSNATNFVVPSGKTGTFYGDPRCDYTGSLTGAGTFNVYGTWVRCYYKGDWSAFTGTVVPGVQDRSVKGGYDPSFTFNNGYGLPNATLKMNSGITVNFEGGHTFEIGTLTGSGTLSGGSSNTVVIGRNNRNITASTAYNGLKVQKVGSGYMTFSTTNASANIGQMTVSGGQLRLNETTYETVLLGSVVATDSGTVIGRGKVSSITLEAGGQLTPGAATSTAKTGRIVAGSTINAKEGSFVNLAISNNQNGSFSRSYLEANTMITLNGTVNITLNSGYTPAIGDEITFWTTRIFRGTPTLVLPELPEGMEWDTSALLAPTGVLKIKAAEPSGIRSVGAEQGRGRKGIYTLDGTKVSDQRADRLPKGVYVIDGRKVVVQ